MSAILGKKFITPMSVFNLSSSNVFFSFCTVVVIKYDHHQNIAIATTIQLITLYLNFAYWFVYIDKLYQR